MNKGIYKFNKQLIDTVYHMICTLYPVQGTHRDFARFFVLETVARVPYFAYLSCLHLQETFGVRYPTMSDRMRTQYVHTKYSAISVYGDQIYYRALWYSDTILGTPLPAQLLH
jgi:hypothetical protein